MDMTGEYTIKAPPQAVWDGLNNPDILKGAISGCEEFVRDGDGFRATIVAKVGPVKAKFGGRVTLSDLDPPDGYTITGEGEGGAAGFAKGGAKVRLLPDGSGGTILKYEAQAQIGGKLAQIGSRLVSGTARKMADDFFSAFAAGVEAQAASSAIAPESSPVEPAAATLQPSPSPSPSPSPPPAGVRTESDAGAGSKGLPPAIWIGGLVAAVAGILYFTTRN